MAEEIAMAEVMNLLEAEPAAALPAPGPDIPALREQLAILVFYWQMQRSNRRESYARKSEAVGRQRRHEAQQKVRGLRRRQDDRTLIESFLSFTTKALSWVARLKDAEALQNKLKNDYIITKELSNLSGKLALRCGSLLAVANAFLITAEHVDFSEPLHSSRDSDGYPLAGVDEVDNAKQSPLISE